MKILYWRTTQWMNNLEIFNRVFAILGFINILLNTECQLCKQSRNKFVHQRPNFFLLHYFFHGRINVRKISIYVASAWVTYKTNNNQDIKNNGNSYYQLLIGNIPAVSSCLWHNIHLANDPRMHDKVHDTNFWPNHEILIEILTSHHSDFIDLYKKLFTHYVYRSEWDTQIKRFAQKVQWYLCKKAL